MLKMNIAFQGCIQPLRINIGSAKLVLYNDGKNEDSEVIKTSKIHNGENFVENRLIVYETHKTTSTSSLSLCFSYDSYFSSYNS